MASFEFYPSQPPPLLDAVLPHVIISGAGLGGMLLGILLEKAGIPYHIFERTTVIKRLGAVMCLNANVMAIFEQIGLYEELLKISLPTEGFNILKGSLKPIAKLTIADEYLAEKLTGYPFVVFARPRLYDLLLDQIPKEKVHLGKKIMSIQQNKEGVMIRCSDNTTFHGDILVGADGANSGVRHSLYKSMADDKILPATDKKALNKGFICMVGTTRPLDPSFIQF